MNRIVLYLADANPCWRSSISCRDVLETIEVIKCFLGNDRPTSASMSWARASASPVKNTIMLFRVIVQWLCHLTDYGNKGTGTSKSRYFSYANARWDTSVWPDISLFSLVVTTNFRPQEILWVFLGGTPVTNPQASLWTSCSLHFFFCPHREWCDGPSADQPTACNWPSSSPSWANCRGWIGWMIRVGAHDG